MVAGRTRHEGYLGGLAAAGPPVDERALGDGDFSQESGEAAMRVLCPGARLDGVFCANDLMAAGALRVLREAGRRSRTTSRWSASTTHRSRCPRIRR